MAWIDYDMVPHSWIQECLDLFGVAENIKILLMLCAGNSDLGEVDIK